MTSSIVLCRDLITHLFQAECQTDAFAGIPFRLQMLLLVLYLHWGCISLTTLPWHVHELYMDIDTL